MIEIDGSQGEGGGQIIRSSLALATVTGQDVRLTHIRAGRSKPGLMRQHLAAARAAATVSGGSLTGDDLGSQALTFHPGTLRGGDFEFAVGTAGSTTLIAQTVLPALLLAGERSTVTIHGGTHNPWAPSADFLERSFLPLVRRMGGQVECRCNKYGFYPAGGGTIEISTTGETTWKGIEIDRQEGDMVPRVRAIVSSIPKSVAQRECDTIWRKTQWPEAVFSVHEASDPKGPGNAVIIDVGHDNVCESFIGLGKPGLKAEHVARGVLKAARNHLANGIPVGEYLADQLMMPMALAAMAGQSSRFRTGPLSGHSRTHLAVIERFLDIHTSATPDGDTVEVSFRPSQ